MRRDGRRGGVSSRNGAPHGTGCADGERRRRSAAGYQWGGGMIELTLTEEESEALLAALIARVRHLEERMDATRPGQAFQFMVRRRAVVEGIHARLLGLKGGYSVTGIAGLRAEEV